MASGTPVQGTTGLGELLTRYVQIRDFTRQLAAPLSAEDCVVQSMPDASPTKWHLAHVSWFFETFVLKQQAERGSEYQAFDADFEILFNSYYNSVGAQYPRGQRGLVTRPDLATVLAYRGHVDRAVARLLNSEQACSEPELSQLVELGLQHEQQHQELLLMDIKHALFQSPKLSAYAPQSEESAASFASHSSEPSTEPAAPLAYLDFGGGLAPLGHDRRGFCFDNERPRHQVHLEDFRLANRLVTNAEYLDFIKSGGYAQPLLWLSDGWARVQSDGWRAPLYWLQRDGVWFEYTLRGLVALDLSAPVCHVSYFEAEAFASWAGARLPTEFEWERAAQLTEAQGALGSANFVESARLHPRSAQPSAGLAQLFGDCWEWTASSYAPYPGFRPAAGALGEYNGKFMIGQQVLRGGACVTSASHFRASYRNFFYPHQRWMFSGIRLAR